MRFRACLAVLFLLGCDCSGDPMDTCASDGDCAEGQRCADGLCVPLSDAGPTPDAQTDGEVPTPDAGLCPAGEEVCGRSCCSEGEICRFDACVSDLGPCDGNDDCWGDSYCDEGRCIPYGVPADRVNDDACERFIDIEAITPAVQCRWTGPPDGDPRPNEIQVMATPVVVDLDLDGDPTTLSPSIAFTSFPTVGSYRQPGVLRVISGSDCAQQLSFPDPADATMGPASVAVGDLDGDGRPEIVAQGHDGGLKAFGDDGSGWRRLWTSGRCDGAGGRTPDNLGGPDEWGGPSIHDLDDDGVPELVLGAVVYGPDGCVITESIGYRPYSQGQVPVLADVDEDGRVELVGGDGIWEYVGRDWVAEPYFAAGPVPGLVAVADLGDFPVAALGGMDFPEVVVVSSGQARVQTIDGARVFGPVSIPGGGNGGAPTIADFDGDGRRELASAGGSSYVVFDLDCQATGATGTCGSGRTDGVLWTQPSQDASSSLTGSSVFDFDADGAAEAVYADECFLRIYDGADGTVRYSAARSSGTTYENPVIVDVDGDFHSEIVSAVNDYAGTLGCPATDPLRATTTFETNHGIVVLRDELDRWAASRPVWNQHAYAVTHVGDDGAIPRSSAVAPNWRDPALNNFRQNVQGELDARGLADLTAASEAGPLRVLCEGERLATLPAQICNRGTLPLAAGTEIAFRLGAPDGPELCRTPVPVALTVGMCTEVTCTGTLPEEAVDLFVEVDPEGLEEECWEGNNFAILRDVSCATVE
ncbi:MAG: VCBS repeat-containing protein [Myxococcota bacterium]|nr:VCBS repeat-containing protein [Myxococcota bacterium]